MVSFQVPVASEIINLLNFVWSDIIVIAVVMFLSARAAGLVNFKKLMKRAPMSLKPFDLPHIGGGMVMNYGWERSLIALLRISAILSVCIGNFGLQGRSEVSFNSKDASVRVPGRVENFDQRLLFKITEIRMRCAQLNGDGDELFFGSVIDNRCYLGLHEHIFVRSLSLDIVNVTREIVFRSCARKEFTERFYTILNCDDIDLSCTGPFRDFNRVDSRACESVVYDGDVSYYCEATGFDPLFQGLQTVSCRKIGAKKKDIEHWTDLYRRKTNDPLVAIFGSAYGLERSLKTDVPGEDKSVTIFTLWWIIPAIWQAVLVMGLLIWFFWLRRHGAKVYGNDERGLLRLLRETSEVTHDGTYGADINRD